MNIHGIIMQNTPHQFRMKKGEELVQWQIRAREELNRLLGLPLTDCDPDLQIEFTRQMEGFTETRLTFAVEENLRAVAHLWVPDGAVKPPVVICLQGHATGMHISMGRPKYPGDEKTISGGDRDFAIQAVKRGYAAFVLEQRAFGERGNDPVTGHPACRQPAMEALLLGRTLLGERVWDIEKSVDLIQNQLTDLDGSRILIMGNSGGGTASIYAAACDTRIAACMPSCAFAGYKESIGAMEHCDCNYVPGILKSFDMGDLAGLIAPRPLTIVNGKDDPIFPLASAQREFSVACTYYQAANAEENCKHVIGPEGHRFYAAPAWPVIEGMTHWNK